MRKVFVKYRFSFKLLKCKFSKPWVEYIGYDLTQGGLFPAQTKFYLIDHCEKTHQGTLFLAFFSLYRFYNKLCLWFEVDIKLLRRLPQDFYRTPIPLTVQFKQTKLRKKFTRN